MLFYLKLYQYFPEHFPRLVKLGTNIVRSHSLSSSFLSEKISSYSILPSLSPKKEITYKPWEKNKVPVFNQPATDHLFVFNTRKKLL